MVPCPPSLIRLQHQKHQTPVPLDLQHEGDFCVRIVQGRTQRFYSGHAFAVDGVNDVALLGLIAEIARSALDRSDENAVVEAKAGEDLPDFLIESQAEDRELTDETGIG